YRPVFRHPSSRRPCPTASYTLSLHDALPISSVWNNLDIEIQIRTRLQHAWATAVETVDVMKGTDLKSGGGTPDWREFFALAASRSEEHTSELQSRENLVCRLLLEKKNQPPQT